MNQIVLLIILHLVFVGCSPTQFHQTYNDYSSRGTHARGVSGQDSLLYVSGAKGKVVVFNLNTEKVVDSFALPANDLRGVQYSNDHSLLLMNSGDEGIVYKYDFGTRIGKATLFEKGAFFDALSINEFGHGFLMGDPIDNSFVLYKTSDFGATWQSIDTNLIPKPLKNEAGFAASNTGIVQFNDMVLFVTGGAKTARLIKSTDAGKTWHAFDTPMKSGDSFGIYSASFWSENEGVIAGGSYVEKSDNDRIVFMTKDGGKSWQNISEGLPGYMSCIQTNEDGKLIVVTGRLGVYYSVNKGRSWQLLTKEPFYSVRLMNNKVILSGKDGKLSIYNWR